jgi:hypothetical protein
MRSCLAVVTFLPKCVLYAHFVLWVNLTTPRSRLAEIGARCARLRQRLFGKRDD